MMIAIQKNLAESLRDWYSITTMFCCRCSVFVLSPRIISLSLGRRSQLPGNKMGSHNLATLFGPNILHTARGGEFQVESLERAEERQDIISVVKEIIDHHKQIYEVLHTLLPSSPCSFFSFFFFH